MERITFWTAATLSLFILLAVSPAIADSSQRIYVNVPFDFVVSDKTFPAGDYMIAPEGVPGGPSNIFLIRSGDNKRVLFALTMKVLAPNQQNESKLVFHRYGNRYFLRKVWTAGSAQRIELPPTRAERELAKASKKVRDRVAVIPK